MSCAIRYKHYKYLLPLMASCVIAAGCSSSSSSGSDASGTDVPALNDGGLVIESGDTAEENIDVMSDTDQQEDVNPAVTDQQTSNMDVSAPETPDPETSDPETSEPLASNPEMESDDVTPIILEDEPPIEQPAPAEEQTTDTQTVAELPRLSPPPLLPTRCIGAINESGIQYCVNPDTREFSATESNGNLIFSFVLPGDNASNEIESVLTVGDLVLLVVDRFPRQRALTPEERSQQYEVSVFDQGGEFIRTNELTVDLGSVESDEAQLVIDRGDPFDGIRARVVAFQREGSNPQLLFGWHGFRGRDNEVSRTDKWTMAGVSRFDLVTGERRVTRLYPLQEIDDLSIDPRQPDKVRVLTTQVVEWLDSDTLTKLSDNYFDGTGQDQLVQGPRSDHSQINANNYIEIIDRVMPLVNAEPIDKLLDVENELLDGSMEIDSPPTNDFN